MSSRRTDRLHHRQQHADPLLAARRCGRAPRPAHATPTPANTHYGVSPPSWVVRPQTGLPAEVGGDALTLVYGDIASHDVVSSLLEGCVAVVHTTVFFPQQLPGVRSTPSL